MGILTTVGRSLGSIMFTFSLGMLILMISMTQLIKSEALQLTLSDMFEKQIKTQITPDQLEKLHISLLQICNLQNKEVIEYTLGNQKISLECEKIKSVSSSNLPKVISAELLSSMYNKTYECEFNECIQQLSGEELLPFLLSSNMLKFLNLMVLYSGVGIVVSLLLLIISTKVWYTTLKIIGISCIIVGIPYFIIPFYSGLEFIVELTLIKPVLNTVINTISMNYLIVFVFGTSLTIVGFVGGYLSKTRFRR